MKEPVKNDTSAVIVLGHPTVSPPKWPSRDRSGACGGYGGLGGCAMCGDSALVTKASETPDMSANERCVNPGRLLRYPASAGPRFGASQSPTASEEYEPSA